MPKACSFFIEASGLTVRLRSSAEVYSKFVAIMKYVKFMTVLCENKCVIKIKCFCKLVAGDNFM